MARPTEIECEDCGKTVQVAATGRVPKRCAGCRAPSKASATDGTVVEVPVSPAAPLEDGWPQRIAPCAWVDQHGRRYTDLGEANAGAYEIREQS